MRRYAQPAFTLVELMITMVVIVILLGLGVASVSGLQAQARDKEREQDIEAIARGLEERYKRGNPRIDSTTPAGMVQKGAYPGIHEMQHASGTSKAGSGTIFSPIYHPNPPSGGYMTTQLVGVTAESLKTPAGANTFGLACIYSCGAAQNTAKLQEAFGNPGGTGSYSDKYIYEPVNASGNHCWDTNCVRYNLYWISETNKTLHLGIPGLKVVKSKHQ